LFLPRRLVQKLDRPIFGLVQWADAEVLGPDVQDPRLLVSKELLDLRIDIDKGDRTKSGGIGGGNEVGEEAERLGDGLVLVPEIGQWAVAIGEVNLEIDGIE
jgi:hypothetical protein